ncbi:MAG: ribonuclease H-like domain-containing protein [Chthonomonas sp.]|nr:ribonuclease H-like domain-containing protein [Chthonomonas sp.]
MLRQTFCHIPGIGRETERSLWSQGCSDWDSLLATPDQFSLGTAGTEPTLQELRKSVRALENQDANYFRKCLGQQEAWRAWPDFRDSCVYLDIETDGGRFGQSVTVVGLYDGKEFTALIKDDNLDSFLDIIEQFKMIVTFFGTGFDLPMLERRFKGYRFKQIHLDLCYALKRIGYSGGLKKIERQLGIARGSEVDGMNGRDAIRLWSEYRRGYEESLKVLVDYNREDVVNLERLASVAYEGLKQHALTGQAAAPRS